MLFRSHHEARDREEDGGEVKEQQRNENVSQEDEDILDELNKKDLSEKDLKELYDKIQKKNKDN